MKKTFLILFLFCSVLVNAQKINPCIYKNVDTLIKYKNAETISYKKGGKLIVDTVYFSNKKCDIIIEFVDVVIISEDDIPEYILLSYTIPDTVIVKSWCSNNYELVLDLSSKKLIRIDLDAVQFTEWVQDYWVKKGDGWVSKFSKKPLTSKQLWLEWYREVNACWFK